MIPNPTPNKLPDKILNDPELFKYFDALGKSVYQMWFALTGNANPILISTTTNINAKTTTSTELFKVPDNKTFIPLYIVIRVVSFTAGTKSVQAVASFGGNSSSYNDFLNSVTYTVSASGTYLIDKPDDATQLSVQDTGDSFRIKINTGSNATTETWEVDLFGYLI